MTAALQRATAYRRFSASDVLAVLVAGAGIPGVAAPGSIITGEFPAVPVRPLSAYALERS